MKKSDGLRKKILLYLIRWAVILTTITILLIQGLDIRLQYFPAELRDVVPDVHFTKMAEVM